MLGKTLVFRSNILLKLSNRYVHAVSIVMICENVRNYDFSHSSSIVILVNIIITSTYKVEIFIDSQRINIFHCFISIELVSHFFCTFIYSSTDMSYCEGFLTSRTSSVTEKYAHCFFQTRNKDFV